MDLGERFDPLTIGVVGLGGAGTDMLWHMAMSGLPGVRFVAVDVKTHFGGWGMVTAVTLDSPPWTLSDGTGGDPARGRRAAIEDETFLREILRDNRLLFIVAGLGGGTGSGALPVVAGLARELRIPIVPVVTLPLDAEGEAPARAARDALAALEPYACSPIVVPLERLRGGAGAPPAPTAPGVEDAAVHERANETVHRTVRGIAALMSAPLTVPDVGLGDLGECFELPGTAATGSGTGRGGEAVVAGLEAALSDPALGRVAPEDVHGAIVVSVAGGRDMHVADELEEIGRVVGDAFPGDGTTLCCALIFDPTLPDGTRRVVVVATGIAPERREDVDATDDRVLGELPPWLRREFGRQRRP